MFTKTNNPYKFKYLVTGITGPGIECVYLPETPPEDQILFKEEQRFVMPQIPNDLKRAMKEMLDERSKKDRNGNLINPDYSHPLQEKINEWEDQEFERCQKGIWFWNNKIPTYITGFYYWVLTAWNPYFGKPKYRDTDKEITYWIKFWEEDPNSFGGALNTIRRYGKSSIMGAWIVYRTTRNFNHTSGMQGETDKKIASFYRKMVLKPFYKLPYYHQPSYNTDSKQASKIEFDIPPRRSQIRHQMNDNEHVLESSIDFRASGEGEYDGEILHSYIMEEPGKVEKVSLYDEEGEGRWDIIKPCFIEGGEDIIGKCLMGTTVENLKSTNRGGQAYKRLFYDSDYNQKQEDGRTMSGLYSAFLPGDCAMAKYIDEWGIPIRDKAKASLMQTRKVYQKRPSKLAGWIRKYPLTIKEIFYVNPDSCEFNSLILQDRLMELDTSTSPLVDRIELYWQDGKRDSKVLWRHAPQNGWCQVSRGIDFKNLETNLFEESGIDPERGIKTFRPKNNRFAIGADPIEHGVVSQPGRSSKPVIFVKSKYDSSIDGMYTDDLLEQRSQEKYPYKTNRYVLMYDVRPNDPNKFFEYAIMICAFFGCPIHIEQQKYSIINYFHARGYGEFVLHKYKPDHARPEKVLTDGTPASQPIIQEYTTEIASYIENFGHTIPFRELIEDNLMFNPTDTKVHDYTVAMGFTELAAKMRVQRPEQPVKDVTAYFRLFDRKGRVLK